MDKTIQRTIVEGKAIAPIASFLSVSTQDEPDKIGLVFHSLMHKSSEHEEMNLSRADGGSLIAPLYLQNIISQPYINC